MTVFIIIGKVFLSIFCMGILFAGILKVLSIRHHPDISPAIEISVGIFGLGVGLTGLYFTWFAWPDGEAVTVFVIIGKVFLSLMLAKMLWSGVSNLSPARRNPDIRPSIHNFLGVSQLGLGLAGLYFIWFVWN